MTKGKAASKWFAWALEQETDECLEWPFRRTDDGYGTITKLGRKVLVHRAICRQAHGAPPTPEHTHAAHSCDNPPCANKRHLSWKTQSQNESDKRKKGRRS